MDDFKALGVVMGKILESGDEEAIEALRVLVKPYPPSPPGAMGRVGGTASQLAQQFYKTGSENGWATPPMHSQAMERLIHRVTLFLEALLDMFEETRLKEMAGSGWSKADLVAIQSSPVTVDELYQPSYCDDCGSELDPDGDCLVCLMRGQFESSFFGSMDEKSSNRSEGANNAG